MSGITSPRPELGRPFNFSEAVPGCTVLTEHGQERTYQYGPTEDGYAMVSNELTAYKQSPTKLYFPAA